MTEIQKLLFANKDEKYSAFISKLNPTVDPVTIIGVRIPVIRKLARQIKNMTECNYFLTNLPHKYFDENMLHAILLGMNTNYENSLNKVEAFLPYVNNWATCDSMTPKAFHKNKQDLIKYAKKWCKSKQTYTCRFGIVVLMDLFLKDDVFKPDYLKIPLKIHSEEYYVNMAIAWFYATALAFQWESTLPIIINRQLEPWTHNKSIQKARESRRITPEQKNLLLKYKL